MLKTKQKRLNAGIDGSKIQNIKISKKPPPPPLKNL